MTEPGGIEIWRNVLPHSLLEEGESTRLANDDVGPLDNDDGHEESRVAGVFQLLAGIVGLCE